LGPPKPFSSIIPNWPKAFEYDREEYVLVLLESWRLASINLDSNRTAEHTVLDAEQHSPALAFRTVSQGPFRRLVVTNWFAEPDNKSVRVVRCGHG